MRLTVKIQFTMAPLSLLRSPCGILAALTYLQSSPLYSKAAHTVQHAAFHLSATMPMETFKYEGSFGSNGLQPNRRSLNSSRNFSILLLKHFTPGGLTTYYDVQSTLCGDVTIVPIFDDNYSYILADRMTQQCALVDPADPKKVLDVVKAKGLTVQKVLCTHKHWDHAGGNKEIAESLEGVDIVSTAYEDIPYRSVGLKDKEFTKLGELDIQLLHTPCHTIGHSVFFVTLGKERNSAIPILFSGDTLFVGGCGRFFEGSAADMHYALHTITSKLPLDTHVFCGHEYTASNLRFALSVDPSNESLKKKMQWTENALQSNLPTVPSTIEEELRYNPFLRSKNKQIQDSLGLSNHAKEEEVIAELRKRKNSFK